MIFKNVTYNLSKLIDNQSAFMHSEPEMWSKLADVSQWIEWDYNIQNSTEIYKDIFF